MSEQVVVVLATGFEEIEAATPIDVLRRAGVDVVVAGVGATAVQGAHGVTYQCDTALEEIKTTPRAIVLPGGLPGAENLGKSGAVKEMSLKVHESGGICAAICAAPALTFAKFGLLNDCTATCYPTFEKEFDPTPVFGVGVTRELRLFQEFVQTDPRAGASGETENTRGAPR